MSFSKAHAFGLFVFAALSASAQTEQDSIKTELVQLAEVTVNGLALSNANFDHAGAVGLITKEQLLIIDPTIITNELNQIPGVFMHSGALNTNRITIRGIGSRSPFSTNKIRAYYEDIPLTDGGGETTLEDIDLNYIGGIEIQKGPNSSMYGSGLGGVILLKSPEIEGGQHLAFNSTIGSYGLVRVGAGFQIKTTKRSSFIGYQRQASEGYRDNNQFERNALVNVSSEYGEKSEKHFILHYINQKASIPSSLGTTDYNENPSKAAFTWGQAEGFEDYNKLLVGISEKRTLSDKTSLTNSLYANWRNGYEPRPFNILDDQNLGVGYRSRWEKHTDRWQLLAGFEMYTDTYKWKTFENEYEDFSQEGSIKGDLLSSNEERRRYVNFFAESRFNLSEETTLSGGLNLNRTDYRFDDLVAVSGEDQSGDYSFDFILSPRLSLVQHVSPEVNIFALVSHGFSPPSVEETLTPNGDLNTDIQPETGWNREIGIKGNHARLGYEISFYSMSINNLLVTRRTTEDQFIGINAGKTLHNGIEAEIRGLIFKTADYQVTGKLHVNLTNYAFKEFVDVDDDQDVYFNGNQLTGVPKRQMGLSLAQKGKWFFSQISYQFVDRMPITDDNSIYSKQYALAHIIAGVDFSIGANFTARLTYRMDNVFNEKYASMLAINARSFGTSESRYFYPGLPRNHQMSVRMSYSL